MPAEEEREEREITDGAGTELEVGKGIDCSRAKEDMLG